MEATQPLASTVNIDRVDPADHDKMRQCHQSECSLYFIVNEALLTVVCLVPQRMYARCLH